MSPEPERIVFPKTDLVMLSSCLQFYFCCHGIMVIDSWNMGVTPRSVSPGCEGSSRARLFGAAMSMGFGHLCLALESLA